MKILFVVLLAAVCFAKDTYHNPIIDADVPDPGVLYYDGLYWMVTTGSNPSYPIRSSPDLVNWTHVGYVFPSGQNPSWASNDFWAPELHVVNGHLNVYFSATNKNTGLHCIGVATASHPKGPWKATDKCLIGPNYHVIDVTVVKDRSSGKYYAVHKNEADHTPFTAWELSADGLSTVGSGREILRLSMAWEGPLIEGPFFVYRNGWYYLFYSGNAFWDNTYSIGVARSKNVLGPYEKAAAPVYSQMADGCPGHTFTATGHGSVIQIPNTDMWYAINHGYYNGKIQKTGRISLLDRVWWVNDWPIFGQSGSVGEGELPKPLSAAAKAMEPDLRIKVNGKKFSLESYQHYGCITSSATLDGNCATSLFIAHHGFAGGATFSIESAEKPGYYLRHYDGQLRFDKNDGSETFKWDASWMCLSGIRNPNGVSFRPSNYPNNFVRHYNGKLRFDPWDKTTQMAEDATFTVTYH